MNARKAQAPRQPPASPAVTANPPENFFRRLGYNPSMSLSASSRTYLLLSAAFDAWARKIEMPVSKKAQATNAPQGTSENTRFV